ncbi:MAG: YeeE/YedE family protein [Flavobacteriaceae bacterium]|nr:YeeE/YedE family protein [Flavobacteriaceae bacterium]
MNILTMPWPWYVSGCIIALIMFILIWLGKRFGMSSNLRTLCSIGGAGKLSDYFKEQWREGYWNLIVVLGAVIGGAIALHLMQDNRPMALSAQTVVELEQYGFKNIGEELLPAELFGEGVWKDPKHLAMLIIGGFLVGFGARYAGGCTSGHAISGLSNLQKPSLVAVCGFFVGGLVMTWFLLPKIL